MGLILKIAFYVAVIFTIIAIFDVQGMFFKNEDCFKEIAMSYCESNGLEYVSISKTTFLGGQGTFFCEDEREIGFKSFKFTEAEKRRCD